MSLKIEKFSGPGSTPSRRRFWDQVCVILASCRKLPGKNVSVTEYDSGSLIEANPQRMTNQQPTGTGACCYDDGTCDNLTESDCTDAGGNWQGSDTTCEDDPNPCVGACCYEDGSCADDTTPDGCSGGGGTFQDFQSTCDDPDIDCTQGACCFDTFCSSYPDQATCEGDGGVWKGRGTNCDVGNPCDAPTGACCAEDGSCSIRTEQQCGDDGGHYQGDDSTCEDADCVPFLTSCPTSDHSLFVDFTGIVTCGCRVALVGSREITSFSGLSGTLTWTGSNWQGSMGTAHWKKYASNSTCLGTPSEEGDSTPLCIVECPFATGGWVIKLETGVEGGGSVDLFFSGLTVGYPLEVDDDGLCTGTKHAHNGHVSITVI